MDDGYYDALARASDRARRVGWESVARQHLRFEAVRAALRPGEAVLDLGAGLGDLGRYLLERGHDGAYLGVERDPSLVASARGISPAVAVELGDLFACDRRAPVVAAIGTLVDGASLRSDATRFGRLRRLFEVVRGAATRLGVIVVARQEALEARPALAADPALGGMRRAELAWLAPDAELEELTDVDWVVRLPGG
ncbi:MAG: hypothetical protein IT385_15560 [Deltaproteobacteria bacterium]|nr:hypothetical protein [Deltaproteobacteria bacterium]